MLDILTEEQLDLSEILLSHLFIQCPERYRKSNMLIKNEVLGKEFNWFYRINEDVFTHHLWSSDWRLCIIIENFAPERWFNASFHQAQNTVNGRVFISINSLTNNMSKNKKYFQKREIASFKGNYKKFIDDILLIKMALLA